MSTVYLEIFERRNFCELPAELNFHVFIFANGDLTIYIVYIANDLYYFKVKQNGGIVRFCKLRARISRLSRDMDSNGGRNIALPQGGT